MDIPSVAVFQANVSRWDEMLYSDMRASASIYDHINFTFNFSNDAQRQSSQIDSVVKNGVDAIVVNALDVKHVLPSIEKAYDSGVYVVLVGNTLPTTKFHAYAGMNNRDLGLTAGRLVQNHLPNGGNIIEMAGVTDQTWFEERSEAFHNVIDADESINIVSTVFGGWSQNMAKAAVDSLSAFIDKNKVDLIYSYGDDMLVGAIKSGAYPDAIFIGTDGIPGEALKYVASGEIHCSIMTKTGGMEAISSVVDLVQGRECNQMKYCPFSIVDALTVNAANYTISRLNYYSRLSTSLFNEISMAQNRLGVFVCATIILSLLSLSLIIIIIWKNRKLRYSEPNPQMKDDGIAPPPPPEEKPDPQRLILNRFKASVENHLGEANFTIGDIAAELGISRAQLFRKIKDQSGETPNDLLQSMRLNKAREMLKTTYLTISEIAYATGYMSPSYFTKCFKEKYGMLPRDIREHQNRE